jgi:uncharacterized LabA/DUF88 family protein
MRTFIQIDVQNLFFSAKDINKRIDFLKIKEHFDKSGDEIVGMNAYIIRTPDAKSNRFESLLTSLNYNLSIKQASIGYSAGGNRIYKGTDQDMAICIDCMKNIDNFDRWVLMSGDGDFIDLCSYLKKHNKTIEVWSIPGTSFNKRLCDYVDMIFFLNDNFFYNRETGDTRQESLL